MSDKNYIPKVIRIALIISLLACLLDMPYGYYTLVRLFVTFSFVYYAWLNRSSPIAIFYIAIIILFQPLEKLHLGRTLWNIVDVLLAIYLVFVDPTKDKELQTRSPQDI